MSIKDKLEELAKEFSRLSYEEAPKEEVMKAFNKWQDALDKYDARPKSRKPSGSSTVITNTPKGYDY